MPKTEEALQVVEKELVPSNMMELMQYALKNNAAMDVIERMAALQQEQWRRESEMAFNEAMTAAQQEIGRIAPDMQATEGAKHKWASYAKLDSILRPIYVRHGFSLSFNSGISPVPEMVLVECFVSHRGGHTRKYTAPLMPADGKGAKGGDVMTKTFATGAGMSYGARYLLKFIFNIAVGEEDPEAAISMSMGEVDEQLGELERCETLKGLEEAFKTAAAKALEAKDMKAYTALKKAKDKRKKELA